MPMFLFSVVYLVGQLAICVVFAIIVPLIKVAILVNSLLLLAIFSFLIFSGIGRNYISHVDKRQKNHHTEL